MSKLRQIIREEVAKVLGLKLIKESASQESVLQSIKRIRKGARLSKGFTSVRRPKDRALLTISHGGNMGNSVERSVDPNLKLMGFPTVAELKELFPNFKEQGSPDYSWSITFLP